MAVDDLQDWIHSIFGRPLPYIEELGITLVERLPKGAVLRLPYQPGLVGNPDDGVLYGGAVTSLIDSACGLAAMLALPVVRPVATLDLRVDYLRPAAAATDLLARAECYRLTRRIAFCRATAFQESLQEPVAEALGTFMITDLPGPAAVEGTAA